METMDNALRRRIRAVMKRKSISTRALASRLKANGVSVSHVSLHNGLKDRRDPKPLRNYRVSDIADALGVTVFDLTDRESPDPTNPREVLRDFARQLKTAPIGLTTWEGKRDDPDHRFSPPEAIRDYHHYLGRHAMGLPIAGSMDVFLLLFVSLVKAAKDQSLPLSIRSHAENTAKNFVARYVDYSGMLVSDQHNSPDEYDECMNEARKEIDELIAEMMAFEAR